MDACPASCRRPVESTWVECSIARADNMLGPVDCSGRVGIDNVVGDRMVFDIVCQCNVVAGCNTVGEIEGCSWMTVLVFGHVCWSYRRRTTAVDVFERNLTSDDILNMLPGRAVG